jgi:hypothetical protein
MLSRLIYISHCFDTLHMKFLALTSYYTQIWASLYSNIEQFEKIIDVDVSDLIEIINILEHELVFFSIRSLIEKGYNVFVETAVSLQPVIDKRLYRLRKLLIGLSVNKLFLAPFFLCELRGYFFSGDDCSGLRHCSEEHLHGLLQCLMISVISIVQHSILGKQSLPVFS